MIWAWLHGLVWPVRFRWKGQCIMLSRNSTKLCILQHSTGDSALVCGYITHSMELLFQPHRMGLKMRKQIEQTQVHMQLGGELKGLRATKEPWGVWNKGERSSVSQTLQRLWSCLLGNAVLTKAD